MRKELLLVLFISWAGLQAQTGDIVAGEWLVQLAPDQSPLALAQALNQSHPTLRVRYGRSLSPRMGFHLYHYDAQAIPAEQALRWLRAARGVQMAQHNHQVTLRGSQATLPDDPLFPQQWGLNNTGQTGGLPDADIDAIEAWDRSTGGVSGLGDTLVVAVIDDGFDLFHEDLAFWRNRNEIPNNGLDDDGNGYIDDSQGWNAYSGSGNIPLATHGTEVAGVIGALGNNQRGGSGVNWYVQVMAVAGASGSEATVLTAYGYVLEQRRRYDASQGQAGALVVVTNSSFGVNNGNPAQYPLWCAMYDSLGAAGILNVAATMNINTNVDVVGDIPARCSSDYLLAVTNSTNQDQRNGGAAYGSTSVDLAAPGSGIYTTLPSNAYGQASGTSFSAPFVAGTIALLFADACPAFLLQYRNDPAAAALQVREAILRGVDTLSTLSGLVATSGRLNAFRSLQALSNLCENLPNDCLSPYQLRSLPFSDQAVQVSWAAVDSSQGFRIRYRPLGSSTWTDSLDLSQAIDTLSGLNGCTTYEWAVGSRCALGPPVYAPARQVRTLGCCEAPTEATFLTLTDSSATLSWPPVFGANQYLFRYRPLNGTQWDSVIVDTSLVALQGLNFCTQYAWQARSLCNQPGLGYAAAQVFQTLGCGACLDQDYCASQGQVVTYEWIQRVQLGDLDQVSGPDDGYAAYTGVNLGIPVDSPLALTLMAGFAGQAFDETWRIWIDLNRDGTFSEAERLFDSGPTPAPISTLLTIPDSVQGGPTRMRVSMRWAGFDGAQRPLSCGAFPNGEVEDYCVVLLAKGDVPCPATAQVSADFLPGSDTLRLRWLDIPTADSFLVRFRALASDSAFQFEVMGTELRLGDLPACTEYEVEVRARCGDLLGSPSEPLQVRSRGCGACQDFPYCPSGGRGDSLWIERFEYAAIGVTSGSDQGYGDYTSLGQILQRGEIYPLTLVAGYQGENRLVRWRMWVDWNQDGSLWVNDQWLDFSVLAGDTVRRSVSIPTGVAGGSVRLRVSLRDGEPAGPCELFQRGEVEDYCLTLTPGVGLPDLQAALRIYPNPAHNYLRIESPAPIEALRMVDLLGREVLTRTGDRDRSLRLPLNGLAPGWYLVLVRTSQGELRQQVRVR
jgi:hypothetical protein